MQLNVVQSQFHMVPALHSGVFYPLLDAGGSGSARGTGLPSLRMGSASRPLLLGSSWSLPVYLGPLESREARDRSLTRRVAEPPIPQPDPRHLDARDRARTERRKR